MNFKTPFERKVAERLLITKIEDLYRRLGYLENKADPYYAQKSTEINEMCDDYLVYLSQIMSDIEGNLVRAELIMDTVMHEMDDKENIHNKDGVIACGCPLPKKDKKQAD